MQDQSTDGSLPIINVSAPKQLPRGLGIGLALLGVLALIAASIVMVMNYLPNLVGSHTLPAELKDAFFVYQQKGVNTIYHQGTKGLEPVSLGSTLPTVFLSHRGSHFASIQLGPENSYEVRADSTFLYTSKDLKTSAGVSPDGTKVVFAESDRKGIEAAQASHVASFPSSVMLVEKGATTTKMLGTGFSPFFITDDTVAWFSDAGLMRHDLRTGSTTVASSNVKALPPPYPAPAISPDGAVIAWDTPETAQIHTGLIAPLGVLEAGTYPVTKTPGLALSSTGLFVLDRSSTRPAVWKYQLKGGAGTAVPGLSTTAGLLLQLVP